MKSYFHDMFEYNKYANSLFINLIIKRNIENTIINRLMCHVLNAQNIWVSRMSKKVSKFGAWEMHPNDVLIELNQQLHVETQYFNNSLSELDYEGRIKYLNALGEAYEAKIQDGFTQMLHHGSHHRGQIALLLRQMEIEPPASDYILYQRQFLK